MAVREKMVNSMIAKTKNGWNTLHVALMVTMLLAVAGSYVAYRFWTSEEERHPCKVEPLMLCEVFEELDAELSTSTRDTLRQLDAEEISNSQFDVGLFMRNYLGLWEENEITTYFRTNGVDEPDTMSYFLSLAYREYLHGRSTSVTKAIEGERLRVEALFNKQSD